MNLIVRLLCDTVVYCYFRLGVVNWICFDVDFMVADFRGCALLAFCYFVFCCFSVCGLLLIVYFDAPLCFVLFIGVLWFGADLLVV